MRARFHAELVEKLGAGTSAAIVAHLGDRLEGRFGGFGLSVQTVDFTPAAAGAGLGKWDAPSDQPTTRRETHYPGREDPTGHTWGPLLSVLATQLAKPAPR